MGHARIELRPGCLHVPGYLDREAQEALVADLRRIVEAAPFFTPRMPRTGRPFSVRMTNCGPLGWVSDAAGGYRYVATHPETGAPWPPMPALVLQAWRELAPAAAPAEACLVNHYLPQARMGLHRDEDEEDMTAPVVSLSLGDTAIFRIGGTGRRDPTFSIRLKSGDALVLGGQSRLAFHGVDRIVAGSSTLLAGWPPGGGRLNLTLRRVSRTESRP
ncbi:alkylated DNA repair protein (DNA oxidative demethylase) [Tepidamorphus gemmatus]|uniref:Alkylated DNA repair protein (DNA oxidative demethylase) n=1 Tax=Tepidamorphus gemmatus TaxID=747076 RepID=A0A4R3MEM5_9HYPH|nr:alpha-ketoglutarate-dependent dioxygenase AlkB [Tepidamorphus gemmatus]TCT11946.1 alkylated DNA repair protein (DNA oxidative demethylase) [Tepidamorphus gemmatus]